MGQVARRPSKKAAGGGRAPRARARKPAARGAAKADGTPALLTRKQYAEHRGITRQAVDTAIRTGRISTTGRLIDRDAADRDWLANTDQSKPSNSVTGKPKGARPKKKRVARKPAPPSKKRAPKKTAATYADHRAKREEYTALKAQAEYEALSGRLVDAAEVEATAFQAARTARDALYNIPDRLSDVLAHTTDAHEVYRLLRRECDEVCALITRTPITPQGAKRGRKV